MEAGQAFLELQVFIVAVEFAAVDLLRGQEKALGGKQQGLVVRDALANALFHELGMGAETLLGLGVKMSDGLVPERQGERQADRKHQRGTFEGHRRPDRAVRSGGGHERSL